MIFWCELDAFKIDFINYFFSSPKMYKLSNRPGIIKNTSHTISRYGKMLVIHFPCNSIRTENCMKGLWLVFFSYMEIVWLVFFFQKKKSKFSVVTAQKTLKCFASSGIDCSKLFFHKKNFKKNSNHTISIYEKCMVSIFFHTIFFPFFYEEIPISIPKQL